MKSKEERKAARDARNAAIDAKTAARVARIDAWADAKRAASQEKLDARRAAWAASAPAPEPEPAPLPEGDASPDPVTNHPPAYTPSAMGTMASMVVPGLGVFQAAKYYKSQKAYLESLTPEQRAEYIRRLPMGSSGG